MPFFSSVRNAINEHSLIVILIIAATAFNILTIRAGHQWDGDFALNVAHAKNIVHGHNFSDTGYIFNPEVPFISPKSYPPVFPSFLAPVYKFFGVNITAFKIANILVFALFLLVFQRYIRSRLHYSLSRISVVAVMAFSPWFWNAKDRILPDFLFMLFTYCAFLLIDSNYSSSKAPWNRYLLAIFTGFIIYLAYGTRSLGLALVPALILFDIVRSRSISRITIITLAVFSVLYFAQNTLLQTDQSYLSTMKSSLGADIEKHRSVLNGSAMNESMESKVEPASFDITPVLQTISKAIRSNSEYYHQSISAYWASNVNKVIDNLVYVIMGLFAIIGFISLTLRNPSSGDSLSFVYVSIILLVPFTLSRYLLPLIPLYLLYIFNGLEISLSRWKLFKKPIAHNSSIVFLLLIITMSYVGTYSKLDFTDFKDGVKEKESLELFEFIRQNTPANSILISRKPRILALFTGRNSSAYARPVVPENLLNYFDKISATHIVVSRDVFGISETKDYTTWIENNQNKFRLIFENSDFQVYRILLQ